MKHLLQSSALALLLSASATLGACAATAPQTEDRAPETERVTLASPDDAPDEALAELDPADRAALTEEVLEDKQEALDGAHDALDAAHARADANADAALVAEVRAAEAEHRAAAAEQARLERARRAAAEAAAVNARATAESSAAKADAALAALEDIAMVREVDGGTLITLPDTVLFASGASELAPSAADNLDVVADFLNYFTTRDVRIEGFTDAVGSAASNATLSVERAKNVRAHLIAKGVAADRVTAVGMGEQEPVASNASAAGRELNRRVEIFLLADE